MRPAPFDQAPILRIVIADLLETISSNLRFLVPIAGCLGLLLGAALTQRSIRPEEEPVDRSRYRELASHDSPPPRPTKIELAAARRLARALLITAIAMPAVVVVSWVLDPGGFRAPYEPPWYLIALPWAGAVGYLVGLGWMIRIYRTDPEPDQPTWRYRT